MEYVPPVKRAKMKNPNSQREKENIQRRRRRALETRRLEWTCKDGKPRAGPEEATEDEEGAQDSRNVRVLAGFHCV